MRIYLVIIIIGFNHLIFGQGNEKTSFDLKRLPIGEIRLMTPDTNFTTINKDSTLNGEIIEICGSQILLLGQTIGVLKLKTSNEIYPFQVLFFDNNLVEGYKTEDIMKLSVAPYNHKDEKLNSSTGITCIGINGFNLCRLKE